MNLDKARESAESFLVLYGFRIVGAVIILIIGALVATWAGRISRRWLEKHNLEPPIRMLIVRTVKLLVFALAVVLALDKFGVQIAPIIAGVGVVGVGLGLATQGCRNLVAGLTIIFTKPYKIGEYIELLASTARSPTSSCFQRNSSTATGPSSRYPTARSSAKSSTTTAPASAGLNVGVAYDADLAQALSVVNDILKKPARAQRSRAGRRHHQARRFRDQYLGPALGQRPRLRPDPAGALQGHRRTVRRQPDRLPQATCG